MTISSELSADGKELVITVDGRFDFSCHQDFRNAYQRDDADPDQYRIDLKGAVYLDSSALGMLLLLRDYAGGDDANVKILNPSEDVRKILHISNFQRLFVIQ
jgi:anti-anti-sigma factor